MSWSDSTTSGFLCHTSVTPLPHLCHTSVTPLPHLCHTSITPLSHLCHTSVTPVAPLPHEAVRNNVQKKRYRQLPPGNFGFDLVVKTKTNIVNNTYGVREGKLVDCGDSSKYRAKLLKMRFRCDELLFVRDDTTTFKKCSRVPSCAAISFLTVADLRCRQC